MKSKVACPEGEGYREENKASLFLPRLAPEHAEKVEADTSSPTHASLLPWQRIGSGICPPPITPQPFSIPRLFSQTHQALRFCAFSTSCQIFSRCTKARVGRHHVSVSTVRNIKMTRLWSLPTWEPGLLTREWPPCAIEASQRVTPMGFPGPITVPSQESSLSVAPGLRGPCCCVTVCEMMKLAVNSGPI